ncbi:MAG: hypothetical protein LBD73_00540 [Deferribacteraceae bacterium]|jgi:hypothetical protein|nr:hypothetical protein [Deferribacteraceae bacterium]
MKKLVVLIIFLIGGIFFITQKYYALRVINVVGACSHQQVTYSKAFYNPFTSTITFKELVFKDLGSRDYNIKADKVKAFELHRAEGKIIIPAYFIAENTEVPIVEQTVGRIEVKDITSSRLPDNTIDLSAVIKNLSVASQDAEITWNCKLY